MLHQALQAVAADQRLPALLFCAMLVKGVMCNVQRLQAGTADLIACTASLGPVSHDEAEQLYRTTVNWSLLPKDSRWNWLQI